MRSLGLVSGGLDLGSLAYSGIGRAALGILRSYGANAHLYIPGVGNITGIGAGNYLDSAGTTAATVDNPVGLSLDALQAMTLGADVGFDGQINRVDAAWVNNANGTYTASGGLGFIGAISAAGVTAGKTYEWIIQITAYSSGSVRAQNSNDFGFPYASAVGTFKAVGQANTTSAYLYSDAFVGTVKVVSVREILGIHATQATTANKPILRRGLLNLLTQAQAYSHTDWAKYSVGTASAPALGALQLAPDGTTTAQRVTFSCPGTLVGDQSMLDHASITLASGQPYTQIAYIKGTPGQTIAFRNVAGSSYGTLTFDGTWQILTRVETSISTTGSWSIGLRGTTGSTTGTVVVDLWTAGLFQGTYTAQQIIDAGGIPLTTTAAASNSNSGKYSWEFDGVNDSLSLSAPLFQMSDDHCVIAGANCSKTTSWNTVFGQGGATVMPRIQLGIDAIFGRALYYLRDDSATSAQMVGGVDFRNQNVVLTAKKTGSAKVLRVNGALVGTNATVLGTATFTGSSIGSAGSVSGDYFQGSIYPVIAIKGTVTDADLLTLERFVGQLSGVIL